MLHHYQAKSVDDIYLDDFPDIIHPDMAVRYLEETARPNRIIREWDLPGNYGLFVSRYRQFHFQQPWMAYRDVLDDIRSGKVVYWEMTQLVMSLRGCKHPLATSGMTCLCFSTPGLATSSHIN